MVTQSGNTEKVIEGPGTNDIIYHDNNMLTIIATISQDNQ